ncbi:MAG TPA: glycosyltransferase family 2 protein [Patescibacteria group bacterium]
MTLSIIIVSYNTAHLTLQTLESVVADLNRSVQLKGKSEIIVVDNNSSDDSVETIKIFKKNLKNVTLNLIENKENVGFARANNQAIKESHGQYLLLLNSDTIVQPGSLETLINTFDSRPIDELTAYSSIANRATDKLGIVAAQLRNPDGSIQPQGGSFPTLVSLASHLLMLDDLPLIGKLFPSTQHTGKRSISSQQELTPMDWVGGTAMMIRRQVFDDVGLFDEQIFMYGEDVEFCLRAHHHHWDSVIQNQAPIVHLGSASSSSASALVGELKGYLHIWAKHKPLWQMPIVRWLIDLGCRLRIFLFGTILGEASKAEVYKAALQTVKNV